MRVDRRPRPVCWGPALALLAGISTGQGAEADPAGRLAELEARLDDLERDLATARSAAEAAFTVAPADGGMLSGLRIHGGVGQGFAWSDAPHDYLTLETGRGSFAFTDMTLGLTRVFDDRLRLGIQLHNRNFGELGEHRFQLDYAMLDYRFRDWLGVKAGRIKTRGGRANDTQDQDHLHPWIFAPFVYDPTNRDLILNHDGADLYGRLDLTAFGLPDGGQLGYRAFYGTALNVAGEGLAHTFATLGLDLRDLQVPYVGGIDLQYLGGSALEGLTLGATYVQCEYATESTGTLSLPLLPPVVPPALVTPFELRYGSYEPMQMWYGYVEYEHDDLLLAAEVKAIDHHREETYRFPGLPRITLRTETKSRSWYALAGWRWSVLGASWLQTSVICSDHVFDRSRGYTAGDNYLRDLAFCVRLDLTEHWYLKAEVHDLHGWGWSTFLVPAQEGHKSEHWFLFAMKTGVVF